MAPDSTGLPDSLPRNWLDRFAPAWLKPYGRLARWDRPIGWWLLLWPCWWSAVLAVIAGAPEAPVILYLALFMVGAIAMRGAGCTYNDIVDRDLDRSVERTRQRPIASGAIGIPQAAAFLGLQALVGLAVLVQFNRYTVILGIASLAVVAAYPFMKRITDWPQVVLGFAFSWGALVGWSAVAGRLAAAPVALYIGSVLWTVAYDTIYALQDKEDDALVGVRSTARLFGSWSRPAIAAFYCAALLGFTLSFALADTGLLAFLGLVTAAGHMSWIVVTLQPHDPENCLVRFRANSVTGWIVFTGLLLDLGLRDLVSFLR